MPAAASAARGLLLRRRAAAAPRGRRSLSSAAAAAALPGPVVIIGGGAMGSASAHWIAKRLTEAGHADVPVTIVERDPSYTKAASALAAGGMRYQFSNPLNVAQSLFSREVLADSEAQLGLQVPFIEAGYLFLASTEGGAAVLRENHAVQAGLGAPVSLCEPEELARRFPWLQVDDIVLGALGVGCDDGSNRAEGFFDPYLLTTALNKSARRLGAQQVVGSVTKVLTEGTGEGGQRVTGVLVAGEDGTEQTLPASIVVNCGGPWAGAVAATHGLDLPVVPKRRMIYQVACDDARYLPSVSERASERAATCAGQVCHVSRAALPRVSLRCVASLRRRIRSARC
jgi:FAD-dependent oxidoreductase domain-containing protein 1